MNAKVRNELQPKDGNMKDKMLEIIIKNETFEHLKNPTPKREETASEIADMVQKFVEWKEVNTTVNFYYHGKEGLWYFYKGYYYTFDELFTYYWDNIKDKDK